ncbi:MAG: stage V sporulation protein AE [Symbiobacteriia bacterium]
MAQPTVRVIVVTDGDGVALDAVQTAAAELGLRTISRSAGHPTRMTGFEMASLSQYAPYDPVVVMVDDRGHPGEGPGERALVELSADPRVEILGVVAVAARTDGAQAVRVNRSVSARGEVVPSAVNKEGQPLPSQKHLAGDTVSVLDRLRVPVVIGTGDSGKGQDAISRGAPLTRRALEEVLRHHGIEPLHRPAPGQ